MSKYSALIIDDLKAHRSFIKAFLVNYGFEVDTAEDGLEGLSLVGKKNYQLIFCDMEMPNMNGLEFLKALKAKEQYSAIPVIMLSTVTKPEMKDKAKQLGAAHYMVKPFTTETMDETLIRFNFKSKE